MDVHEYPEPVPERPDGQTPAADTVPAGPPDTVPTGSPDTVAGGSGSRSTLLKGGGLLLAGLVAGAIGVAALHGSSGTPALAASGGVSAGSAPFDRGASGGRGGVDGEQHVSGTLTAVSASSVTVRSTSGSTTVPVSASTQVLRDGSTAALSSLKVGEAVLVHVLPSGSGTVAEKVLVGTVQGPGGTDRPDSGGSGPPPGDGDGPDGGSGSATGGTSTDT